jgi:paraquat-inducible protein A
MWALSSTGLILWILANVSPILTFTVAGNAQSNLISTGVWGLQRQGFWPISLLVFFCAIAAPLLHMFAMWYVSGACCTGRRWPRVRAAWHLAEHVAPWSLMPVFAIACFVAVVKLKMLGTVYWDSGIVWISLLSLCSLLLAQVTDRAFVENQLSNLR